MRKTFFSKNALLSSCLLFLLSHEALTVATFRALSVTPGSGTLSSEPITIVFSHAVIPFGFDISGIPNGTAPAILRAYRGSSNSPSSELDISDLGSWRFITTSIARFDLKRSFHTWPHWPTDLYVEIAPNAALTSATGETLSLSDRVFSGSWSTERMEWHVASVTSEFAMNATDNAWTSTVYGPTSGVFEVPQEDGVVQVLFSTPVSLALVSAADYFSCRSHTVTVDGSCGSNGETMTTCVNVKVDSPVLSDSGDRCALTCSSSMLYHELSGPHSDGSSQNFNTLTGPVNFEFGPFIENSHFRVRSKHLTMYIRHGLELARGTDLANEITVSPTVEGLKITVPERYMVLIEGDFQPRTDYTISIAANASIQDNFGMELQASSGKFTMDQSSDLQLFFSNEQVMQLHPSDLLEAIPLIGRGSAPSRHVRTCEVNTENLEEVLGLVFGPRYNQEPESSWYCEGATTSSGDGRVDHNISFPDSDLLLVELQTSYTSSNGNSQILTQFKLLSAADLHVVTALTQGTVFQKTGSAEVLVSRLSAASVVDGATVTMFEVEYNEEVPVMTRKRDAATIGGYAKLEGSCSNCVVVVTDAEGLMAVGGSMLYLRNHYENTNMQLRAQIVFDRSLYSPGEEVTATGWVVEKFCRSGPDDVDITCHVGRDVLSNLGLHVMWSSGGEMVSIEGDDDTGMFSATFTIPPDQQYGARPYVNLYNSGETSANTKDNYQIETLGERFLIADPRLPSALMTLDAPEYMLLSSSGAAPSISFDCAITTFTSIPLNGIDVQFKASLMNKGACGNTVAASAESVVDTVTTAGADGVARFSLTVPDGWELVDGMSVEIFASAVGPTGAVLGERAEVKLFDTMLELTNLQFSVEEPLPIAPFAVFTMLSNRSSKGASPSLASAKIIVLDSTECKDASLFDAAAVDCAIDGSSITCEDVTYSSDSETIALVVVATTASGEEISQCARVGTPLIREWQRTMAVAASLNAAGNQIEVKFRHPFGERDAVAWVVWPSGHSGLEQLVAADGMRKTLVYPIANVSALGSSITVTVHAWLPVADPMALDLGVDVQSRVSNLLGKWGLLAYSGSTTIEILGPVETLRTEVMLDLQESADPEEEVTLMISAAGVGAGKAIVFVVDSSIFELEPKPLPDAPTVLGNAPGATVSIQQRSQLFSGAAIDNGADILEDLLLQDPFIYFQWSSLWVDGDFEEITSSSHYQQTITEGNIPYRTNYPGFLADNYANYYFYERGGCYSYGGGGMYYDDEYGMPVASEPEMGVGGDGSIVKDPSSSTRQGGYAMPVLREGVETVRLAVFEVVDLVGGEGALQIKLPADRKRWSVRVHVVSSALKFGSAEAFVTVSSPVYLQAYTPRALRLMDNPVFGALVQTDPNKGMFNKVATVTVVEVDGSLELETAASVSVQTNVSSRPALFRFKVIRRPEVGSLAFADLRLEVEGEVVDRMRLSLDVTVHAHPLLIGTSRAVLASEGGGAWSDVLALPAFLSDESTVTLRAAVSQYDRILEHCRRSAFDPIISKVQASLPQPVHASEAISAAYCLHKVRAADQPDSDSGYLSDTMTLVGILKDSFTDGSGRLQSHLDWNTHYISDYTDVRLAAAALLMVRLTSNGSELEAVSSWLREAVNAVNSMQQRYPSGDYSWYAAHLWLAVGGSSTGSITEEIMRLPSGYNTLQALKRRISSTDVSLRLLVNAAEDSADPTLIASLMSSVRLSSDQTGYLTRPGSVRALESPWQSFGLLTLCQSQAMARDERTWRVAVYIGQGGEARFYPWMSRFDTLTMLVTGMALSKLDEQTDNVNPDVNIEVTLDDTRIWETTLDDQTRQDSQEISNDTSSNADNILSWAIRGTGTVFTYISAFLVPTEAWPTPISRGFTVQKLIQALDPASGVCSGGMVTSVQSGTMLCVTLLVTTPDDVRVAKILDWSPSGVEPLDSNVDAISAALAAVSSDGEMPPSSCPQWWGWCWFRETRQVKATSVEWEVQSFVAGSREFRYVALANVPGKYMLPASVATDSDNPSYTGLSGTAEFVVLDDNLPNKAALIPAAPSVKAMSRRLLLSSASSECDPVKDLWGGWCDEATGEWMCGQVVCSTECEEAPYVPGPPTVLPHSCYAQCHIGDAAGHDFSFMEFTRTWPNRPPTLTTGDLGKLTREDPMVNAEFSCAAPPLLSSVKKVLGNSVNLTLSQPQQANRVCYSYTKPEGEWGNLECPDASYHFDSWRTEREECFDVTGQNTADVNFTCSWKGEPITLLLKQFDADLVFSCEGASGSSTYRFFGSGKERSFEDAQQVCEAQGSGWNLVFFETEEERDLVRDVDGNTFGLIGGSPVAVFWVGASRATSNAEWLLTSGEPFCVQGAGGWCWAYAQDKGNCVSYNQWCGSFMNEDNCSEAKRFVCELNPVRLPVTSCSLPGVRPREWTTGGLGKLMREELPFRVWLCSTVQVVGPGCGNATDPMCFVYHEEREVFVPWAKLSELQLF